MNSLRQVELSAREAYQRQAWKLFGQKIESLVLQDMRRHSPREQPDKTKRERFLDRTQMIAKTLLFFLMNIHDQ
jgi:hypothetical protein